MYKDLLTLSLEELSELIATAQKALQERQKAHEKDIIRQIYALAESIGLKVSLHPIDAKSNVKSLKGSKAPIRYRNPLDHGQTWSGRGLKPKWLQSEIAAGHTLESFKV